jgi:hypothetical protein
MSPMRMGSKLFVTTAVHPSSVTAPVTITDPTRFTIRPDFFFK